MTRRRYVSTFSAVRLGPRRRPLHCRRRVNAKTQRVTLRTVRPARIPRPALRPEAIPNPERAAVQLNRVYPECSRMRGLPVVALTSSPFPFRTTLPPHEHSGYTPLHSSEISFCLSGRLRREKTSEEPRKPGKDSRDSIKGMTSVREFASFA